MRVLGVDLGARRIGLAVSDEAGQLAFPAGFLPRRGRRQDFPALQRLVAERGIERIVVGLPIHMSGRSGPEAAAARRFAAELARATGLPVDLQDERWTTRQAERGLREAAGGRLRRREKGAVDAAAATILLQTYLDGRRSLATGLEDA